MPNTQIKRKIDLGLLAKDMLTARRSGDAAGRAKQHLIERLGKLHGLPQKIGQLLSLGELEDDQGDYMQLTEGGTVLPPEQAFAEMEDALGAPLSACFEEISEEAISASLSQVHRATLLDGRDVAVKLQYPGIGDAVWHDLKALGWLTAPVGGLKRGFNLGAYQDEVRAILEAELDYTEEARTITMMREHTAGMANIQVPEVVPEFSGERMLTMSWMDGVAFTEARQWPKPEREILAGLFLRLFLRSCFSWGLLHGDPHPGNFRFRRGEDGPSLVLLDFGCVKRLPDETSAALLWLVRATVESRLRAEEASVFEQYVAMGFDRELLEPMAHRLAELTETLFEPFRYAFAYDLEHWRLGERVEEILGEDRWNFRIAGPADLLVFIRAYQGLIQYLKALDVPLDWQRLFREETAGQRAEPVKQASAAVVAAPRTGAKSLKVKVSQNGSTRVALTFNAAAAERIDELMPDDVLGLLKDRDIDIEAIRDDVTAGGFRPGDLFQLENEGKTIRVWLE